MQDDPRTPVYSFRFVGGISSSSSVIRTVHPPEDSNAKPMVEHIRVQVNDAAVLVTLGRGLPSIAADLIDVMVAIYIADRQSPRFGRRRRMHVEIPSDVQIAGAGQKFARQFANF